MMKSLSSAQVSPRYLAVVLVALALSVAGCATPDNRTPQERASDQALVRRIEAALTAEPYLDADHVTIEVRRGAASLSGVVADAADLQSVLRVCYAVPGVVRVDDQIKINDFPQDRGRAGGHGR